ncbi:hypothetical protein SAMN05216436_106215 [bacterium A37T11]|nr:hypothetical protein SAMN05216436_106215 [bacterium A37T11]
MFNQKHHIHNYLKDYLNLLAIKKTRLVFVNVFNVNIYPENLI